MKSPSPLPPSFVSRNLLKNPQILEEEGGKGAERISP